MRVYIEQQNKHVKVSPCATGKELLEQLGLCEEDVILTKNGTVVMAHASLAEGDDICVLSVISGG